MGFAGKVFKLGLGRGKKGGKGYLSSISPLRRKGLELFKGRGQRVRERERNSLIYFEPTKGSDRSSSSTK